MDARRLRERHDSRLQPSLPIDSSARILNHIGLKARVPAIDGGVAHAVVISQAGQKDALQPTLAQIASEAGACDVIVLD